MLWKRPVVILCVVTFCLYFFSLFNQFVWDDEQFIYRNEYVKNFAVSRIFTTNTVDGAGEISNYYRPLTTLSFALDYQFWQLNPFGYHLVNTLFHIATGVLLYMLLKRLKFSKPLSFATALIFLIHPLQTEAIAYANSRGDSLFSFFLMISLILHTLLFETKELKIRIYENSITVPKVLIFSGVLLTFTASILSKEIGLAGLGLHGLVIARYFLLNSEGKKYFSKNWFLFFKDNIWSVGSFLVSVLIAVVYLLLRSSVLNFSNTFNFYDYTSIYSESLAVRLLTFFKIIFIYIKLFFIPYPLHMERDTAIITSGLNAWLFAFIVLCIALGAISYWQWKKYRKTTILFGWAWLSIMLVPVSGIIAINGLLYEHWLYLPLVGFFIITYESLELISKKLVKDTIAKYFFFFVVIVLSFLTIRQNYFWSSPIRLYNHLLQYTDSARIHNNLAMAYSDQGMYQEALEHYKIGLAYGQAYPQIYHNIGNTYAALGDTANAEISYKKALEISPEFYHTYTNLINVYIQQNKFDAALEIAHLAQSHYPDVFDYQVIELKILGAAKNKKAFEEKKNVLLRTYSSDPKITAYLNTLQLP
jgi:tetratricopeptide (TPR) repeat protein